MRTVVTIKNIAKHNPCPRGWKELMAWAYDRKSVTLREIFEHQDHWDLEKCG